jgi:ribonucleoside-diphosphate reductase alpha chain
MLHYQAWKKGVKAMYYCRSKSLQRAEVVSLPQGQQKPAKVVMKATGTDDSSKYEECLSCQG